MKKSLFIVLQCFLITSCNFKAIHKNTEKQDTNSIVINVDTSLFLTDTENIKIKTIDCTLSDGTETKCYEITTKSIPIDHEMGPWCPETINDGPEKSGKWFKDGKIYNADGSFFKNIATLYDDKAWKLHDDNGAIFKTKTKDDCVKLAGAQLVDEFTNFCIECLPEYVKGITKTYRIPINPIKLKEPISLIQGGPKKGFPSKNDRRPPPPPNGERPDGPPPNGEEGRPNGPPTGGRKRGPISRGIAFNGVVFDAPAPLHLILSGYSIPAFDNAGGHINMDAGYHYHAATGITKEIKQKDEHAPMIGYAMDGYGLYAQLNKKGQEPNDLDSCRGHYDTIRGYHYHVDAAGSNNFINCFSGAVAK